MACTVERPIANVNTYSIRPNNAGVWTTTQGIPVDHRGLLLTTPNGPKVNIPIARDATVAHASRQRRLYRCSLVEEDIGGLPKYKISAYGTAPAGTLILVYTEPGVVWARNWKSQFGSTTIWPGVEPNKHLKVSVGPKTDKIKRHLVWVRPGEGVLCADSNGVVAEIVGTRGFEPPTIRLACKHTLHSHLQAFHDSRKPHDTNGKGWASAAMKDLARTSGN